MVLLIVDDEELTRSGVISSIDWENLGITKIIQAEDGLHGLEAARLHHPEIILSDVRMPRMDGITMLKKLEEELPDTCVIFMSGYSDKQYLKAAIKLKAVSYIEKPIQTSELRDAVQEAIGMYRSRIHSLRGRRLQSLETKARLAALLISPNEADASKIRALSSELNLTITEETWFTSVIIHFSHSMETPDRIVEPIVSGLEAFLEGLGLNCLHLTRRIQYLVFMIIGEQPLPDSLLHAILSYLKSQFEGSGKFYITAGESTCGPENAFLSYSSAVGLIQNSFFFPSGTILTSADSPQKERPEAPSDTVFAHALSSVDREAAENFLEEVRMHYANTLSSLPNLARDRYYRLFMLLRDALIQQHLPAGDREETILSSMEQCFTYQELHDLLVHRTEKFFDETEEKKEGPENATIQLIEDFIEKNYMKEGLSVKDISAHVYLSASYVCTVFKNETGKTLSQYITDFRMEKAKQLLSDPRFRISDISSQVGYSDGNYFGKSFKKHTGMTPSEYRERIVG